MITVTVDGTHYTSDDYPILLSFSRYASFIYRIKVGRTWYDAVSDRISIALDVPDQCALERYGNCKRYALFPTGWGSDHEKHLWMDQ